MASENENQQKNPWSKSPETKIKMSISAAKKWISETGLKLKEKLSKLTAEKMANGKLRRSHSGYFYSEKMKKDITWFSTYELRAIHLCENDPSVITYETSFYYTINGRNRVADILINQKHLKEIKPKPILDKKYENVELQIKDGQDFAASKGYTYEVWSEKELQIENHREFQKWADDFRKSLDGVDQAAIRKQKALERQKRYYDKWIKNDMVEFHCKYCNKNHKILKLTYERDVLNNDNWVCHSENARRTGRLPKNHLKKINPYESEGKKECRTCGEIKEINGNFTYKDKARGTYMLDCNSCRAKIATAKYQANKEKTNTDATL